MKKIIATVLAMVMALALCTTAFAAADKYDLYLADSNNISGGKLTTTAAAATGLTNIDLTVTAAANYTNGTGHLEYLSLTASGTTSCYEMTFFNRKSQRTFTCQIVQNTKWHLKRAKTMQISGIGHSVIRGLVTTGQWFSASTTVYPRGSPQGRRHSYFVDC